MVEVRVIPQGVAETNPGVAMWTPTTRQQHIRATNRYQTDLTDEEWRVIETHLPAANQDGATPRQCARSSMAFSM